MASVGCDSASSLIGVIGCFSGLGGGSNVNGLGDGCFGRDTFCTVVCRWVMESSCAVEVICFVMGDLERDERADKGSKSEGVGVLLFSLGGVGVEVGVRTGEGRG